MLQFTIELARQAGALLRAGLEGERNVELKSAFEAVTDIDRASEALIVAAIAERYPDHTIIGEEGGGAEQDSPYVWLIDPLDGTNNYVHRFPFFCVSLGLWHAGAPLIGVVYDPLRDELFSAEAGKGAMCNGRRLHVSATPQLASALISTGFPYDFATSTENNTAEFERLQARTQGVRRAGAAALDLAYVAAGRLDAHWEQRLKPWDMAAGLLLVQEAGGMTTDWSDQPANPWTLRVLASNGSIHAEILAVLNADA